MKTSARNQFSGVVDTVQVGAVYAEVHIALLGGETIVASVTKESAAALGLREGLPVLALVKAPQIVVVADFAGYKLSARNQLTGVVRAIKAGAVNAEVIIALPGGVDVAATVTLESLAALQLSEGRQATAVFKASSVLLAVPS